MNYPTIEEVETADRIQLASWYRFLPSPGTSALGEENYEDTAKYEISVLNRITERFGELGGMNPEISKKIGWRK